jgi:hypothetical protein
MSDDENNQNYEVGKAKPPKHTQWKKGHSGNPSGKKKKEETLRDKLKSLLKEEIVLHQNGSPVAMQQDDAMLLAQVRKAINKGDTAAFKAIFEIAESKNTESAAPHNLKISTADIAVLETHADWVGIVEDAKSRKAADADDDTASQECTDDGK